MLAPIATVNTPRIAPNKVKNMASGLNKILAKSIINNTCVTPEEFKVQISDGHHHHLVISK